MIKSVVTDFSKVLLFAKDPNYSGGLNALNNKLLSEDPNYSFGDYFTLNDELLEYYSRLNSKVRVYVFTSETIQDHPAIKTKIKNAFSGVMSAKKLHLSKSDSDAYQSIADQVHCLPGEVLYIDDKATNIEAAVSAGLQVLLYSSNEQDIPQLENLLSAGS